MLTDEQRDLLERHIRAHSFPSTVLMNREVEPTPLGKAMKQALADSDALAVAEAKVGWLWVLSEALEDGSPFLLCRVDNGWEIRDYRKDPDDGTTVVFKWSGRIIDGIHHAPALEAALKES